MIQFATFRLDSQLFGVDVMLVREINRQTEITRVQHSPGFVRGLINLRGHIVTIVDLGVRMGFGERTISGDSHNIILKSEDELVSIRRIRGDDLHALKTSDDVAGFLVDDIGDVVDVDESQIESSPANLCETIGKYISGVVKLDSELLLILNVEELLKKQAVTLV